MFSLLNVLYFFSLIFLFDILFIMHVPHPTLQIFLFYFSNSFVKQTVYICFVLIIPKHTNVTYRQVFCNASSTNHANSLSILQQNYHGIFLHELSYVHALILLLLNSCKCRKYGEFC